MRQTNENLFRQIKSDYIKSPRFKPKNRSEEKAVKITNEEDEVKYFADIQPVEIISKRGSSKVLDGAELKLSINQEPIMAMEDIDDSPDAFHVPTPKLLIN